MGLAHLWVPNKHSNHLATRNKQQLNAEQEVSQGFRATRPEGAKCLSVQWSNSLQTYWSAFDYNRSHRLGSESVLLLFFVESAYTYACMYLYMCSCSFCDIQTLCICYNPWHSYKAKVRILHAALRSQLDDDRTMVEKYGWGAYEICDLRIDTHYHGNKS